MKEIYTLRRRTLEDPVTFLNFFQSNRYLLASHESGLLVLWLLQTRRPLVAWQAHQASILRALQVLLPNEPKDQISILSQGRDDKMHLWQVSFDQLTLRSTSMDPVPLNLAPVWSLDVNSLNFCGFSWNPKSLQLAIPAFTDSNLIDMYDISRKEYLHRNLGISNASKKTGILMCLEFMLRDSFSHLIAGYEDGTLIVWDVTRIESGVPLTHSVKLHSEPVLSLSLYGDMIFSGSADGTLKALDTSTWNSHLLLTHPEGKGISSLSVDQSREKILVAGCWDGSTLLYSLATDSSLGTVNMHRSRVNVVVHASVKEDVKEEDDELDDDDVAEPGTLAIGSADGRISLILP